MDNCGYEQIPVKPTDKLAHLMALADYGQTEHKAFLPLMACHVFCFYFFKVFLGTTCFTLQGLDL